MAKGVKRRTRMYSNYVSTHAALKSQDGEARLYLRDVQPHLPQSGNRRVLVIDLGCGQGHLVRQLSEHGYEGAGVDISPEQIALAHRAGVSGVQCGDYRDILDKNSGNVSAVTATDFLEHFNKDEVLEVFDRARAALAPGGVFIARCPNGASPFFGNYQYGDFTHETVLTPQSFAQLSRNAGFGEVRSFSCPPVVHGAKSAARRAAWWAASCLLRAALIAETGATDHIVTQNFVGVAWV